MALGTYSPVNSEHFRHWYAPRVRPIWLRLRRDRDLDCAIGFDSSMSLLLSSSSCTSCSRLRSHSLCPRVLALTRVVWHVSRFVAPAAAAAERDTGVETGFGSDEPDRSLGEVETTT